jgi:predicted metal-dependent hydrolase
LSPHISNWHMRTASPPNVFWNHTAIRTHLFDAFSVLLPIGEAFVIEAVSEAASRVPAGSPLQADCQRFVQEERAHQRAHHLYNQNLAKAGHDVAAMEARIEKALNSHKTRLSADQRLCLAAAFEHITATISGVALRSDRVLASAVNTQTHLWRWHCAEEVAHARVTVDLLAARNVSYFARVGWYVLASFSMFGDVVRHMQAFYRNDVRAGRLSVWQFWKSTFASVARATPALGAGAVGWAAYLLPRRVSGAALLSSAITVRLLQTTDLPALMALEAHCWAPEQAASEADMVERIRRHSKFCLGAFCPSSGKVLASLFMKPTTARSMSRAKTWRGCTEHAHVESLDGRSDALFGISLSSTDPAAVKALLSHFWPRALKGGWRHIFLGSPIPGLATWLGSNPGKGACDYVAQQRRGVPLDPQLRYYHRKGFRCVEAVLPDYFPHQPSLDHGVLLRGTVPGSWCAPVWRCVPLRGLEWMKHWLFKLL